MSTNSSSILPLLFGDLADRFMEEIVTDAFVVHGVRERFNSLADIIAQLEDVDVILKGYPGPVAVYGAPVIQASGGVTDRYLVPVEKAKRWYYRGAALEMDFFEIQYPQLRRRAMQLLDELGLWPGSLAKCIVYCATAEGGFAPHFDAYVNIVLQLHGSKHWRIAPNRNAVDPVQHYDLAEAPYLPIELASYWSGDAPSPDLPEGRDFVLRPGSALFLPRGAWHATRSNEPTVSLNFTFSQPTWADVTLAALRRVLVRQGPWRKLARPADLSQLKDLLRGFQDIELDAETIVGESEVSFDEYQEAQAAIRQLMVQNWEGR